MVVVITTITTFSDIFSDLLQGLPSINWIQHHPFVHSWQVRTTTDSTLWYFRPIIETFVRLGANKYRNWVVIWDIDSVRISVAGRC